MGIWFFQSLVIHPRMRPLLHVLLMGRLMRCGEGVGKGLRGRDTARLDASLHDVIRSVPACCDSRIQGLPEYYDCSYARWGSCSNSRPVRGHQPRGRGGTKWVEGRGACRDVGRLVSEPQTEDFPGTGNRGKVVKWLWYRPRTPFVTPVLPGPGSDIRLKMGWKIMTKNGKVWGLVFQECRGMWERWVLPVLTGAVEWVSKGSYRTAWAVPCGSSCSCSYSYGRGSSNRVAYWRAVLATASWCVEGIAHLMQPWCAEGEVPIAANLNLHRGWRSCVGWHRDDEPLFGREGVGTLRSSLFR